MFFLPFEGDFASCEVVEWGCNASKCGDEAAIEISHRRQCSHPRICSHNPSSPPKLCPSSLAGLAGPRQSIRHHSELTQSIDGPRAECCLLSLMGNCTSKVDL